MSRLSQDHLTKLPLDACEEALAEAEFGPVRRTWALRLSLAYLASNRPGRWLSIKPFRQFWRALPSEDAETRRHALNAALSGIYAWAGVPRDRERALLFRGRASDLRRGGGSLGA